MLRLLVYCRDRASARLRANNRWSIGARCRTRRSAQLGLARQVVDSESRRFDSRTSDERRVHRWGVARKAFGASTACSRASLWPGRSACLPPKRFAQPVQAPRFTDVARADAAVTMARLRIFRPAVERRSDACGTITSAVLILLPDDPEPAGDHFRPDRAPDRAAMARAPHGRNVLAMGASQHHSPTRTNAPH